jgi:Putative auto-transporter adhesin, head GIN domain
MRSTVLIVLLLWSSTALAAETTIRNFGIRSFEKIRIEGPYRVTLKTGVAPFARAKGPQAALDRIDLEMRGDVLLVRSGPFAKNPAAAALAPVEVELGTHDLSSAALTGAGSLAIDKVKGLKFDLSVQGAGTTDIAQVAVDQLSLNLGGNAAARLAGKSQRLTAILRGLSTVDLSGLQVSDAVIGAEGPSTVRATVTKAAKIDGRGTASFVLAGRPSCTLKVQGSVSVTGCK